MTTKTESFLIELPQPATRRVRVPIIRKQDQFAMRKLLTFLIALGAIIFAVVSPG
jgi:hypothetical protein